MCRCGFVGVRWLLLTNLILMFVFAEFWQYEELFAKLRNCVHATFWLSVQQHSIVG